MLKIIFLIFAILHSHLCLASLNDIKLLINMGDFVNAESDLLREIQKENGKKQKAELYKYLGVCQYSLNDKTSAKIAFTKALSLNPSLDLLSGVKKQGGIDSFIKKEIPTHKNKSQKRNANEKI